MRVLITGAAGFIGSHLVQALLARGTLRGANGELQRIDSLLCVDVAAGTNASADPRVQLHNADAADPQRLAELIGDGVDSVFALGATLTAQAESDFARGLEVNVYGMQRLLEACRLRAREPRLVFTSSIAAFGGPLPEIVGDAQSLTPQTSYGMAKAVSELLIDDYSRRAFIDGRALRLPVVLVRPGPANPAISDRVAQLIREPLQGRDVICPLRADTLLPVASARAVAAALVALHDLPKQSLGHTRALNLHSVSVRIAELVAAVQSIGRRRSWPHALGQVSYAPDAALQAIVDQWPRRFESARATSLGLRGDPSIDAIVDHYLHDYLPIES